MRRILLVFLLAFAIYFAGLLVLALGAKTLAAFGSDGLVSPFLAVGLSILVVSAPVVAGHVVPGAPSRTLPICPHCGAPLAVAKPKPDPSWFS
jgi:hypothetical protein